MRWYEKYIPETDEAEDKCEIYALESEGDALVKYDSSWSERDPEELASAMTSFMFEFPERTEEELAKFCANMEGWVKEWCDSVRMSVHDTEYAKGAHFYKEVALSMRENLRAEKAIKCVWQPVRKGE